MEVNGRLRRLLPRRRRLRVPVPAPALRRCLAGGHRAGAHQPAAPAAAGGRSRRPCGCWSSGRWPRTRPTASPTAAPSPRPSAGSPPVARSPPWPAGHHAHPGPRWRGATLHAGHRRHGRDRPSGPATGPAPPRPTGPVGPMPPLQAPPEDDWDAEDEPTTAVRARPVGLAGRRPRAAAPARRRNLVPGGREQPGAGRRRDDHDHGRATAPARPASSSTPPTSSATRRTMCGRDSRPRPRRPAVRGGLRRPPEGVDRKLDAGDVAGLDPSGGFAEPGTEVTLTWPGRLHPADDAAGRRPRTTTVAEPTHPPAHRRRTRPTGPPPTTGRPPSTRGAGAGRAAADGAGPERGPCAGGPGVTARPDRPESRRSSG